MFQDNDVRYCNFFFSDLKQFLKVKKITATTTTTTTTNNNNNNNNNNSNDNNNNNWGYVRLSYIYY